MFRQNPFERECFENGELVFEVFAEPVSAQNKNHKKLEFRKKVQTVTSKSEFIITSTCWVYIDYHCQHIKRFKNPGVYDIDNIVKPILDSLVGIDGLLIDDVLVDRVIVNWVDTWGRDRIDISIEYPNLLYLKKSDLVFIKSKSGWCYPISKRQYQESELYESYEKLIKHYFSLWECIKKEDDYEKSQGALPVQNFIFLNKIKDRGYNFIDL